MRKYDKKVLRALVVAYKNGLINKKPLLKWTDKKEIFNYVMKYSIFIIVLLFALILNNQGYIVNLNEQTIIKGFIFNSYRINNVLIVIPILLCSFKVINYINKMIFVKKSIEQYKYNTQDIKVIDKVTFKINS